MKTPQAPAGFLEAKIRTGRYYFPGAKTRGCGLRVVGAGFEECHSDFRIDRSSFRYLALELIDAGEWDVKLGSSRLQSLGPGGILVYGPGTRCSVAATGSGPHGKYFLDVAGVECGDVLRDAGLRAGSVFRSTPQGGVAALFEELIGCSNLTARQSGALAVVLSRAIFLRAGAERSRMERGGGRSNPSFDRCRTFLESRYTELESIAEAARACHVSPEYFSRLFRKHTGTTAERYLKKLRLNQAMRLLQQSGFSVKEIALRVGFKDQFHFSKAFKAAHGLSPSAFRGGVAS